MKLLVALVLFWLLVISIQSVAHETGIASWYGPGFEGRRTASGERFRSSAATCAHPRHAFGTVLRVLNLANGRTATCRVNDRGPFIRGRIIDLSRAVARRLRLNLGKVRIEVLR